MADRALLPLFPLQVVLFPAAQLPIHIFEPRYREMVAEAIAQKSEFGVIFAEETSVSSVGCTALVEQVTKRYEDGRFDIMTRGRQRFRALELDQEKDYLRARIDFFQDETAESAPRSVLEEARHLTYEVARALNATLPEDVVVDEPQASFALAAALPLELKFKQQLLEQRSEPQRIRTLVDYLGKVLERARTTQRMQSLARTNGHGGRVVE